jgi:hypothetical protein
MDSVMDFIRNNPIKLGLSVLAVVVVIMIIFFTNKSGFQQTLVTNPSLLTTLQPKSFPPIEEIVKDGLPRPPPVVPEEIGLSMAYPQGSGVGMSNMDSNSFGSPNVLLTDYTTPESYGESSLSDPTGNNGASEGSRILKIKNTGYQMGYKPVDESIESLFAGAYTNETFQQSPSLINGEEAVNYNDNFNPSQNLKLQASPGSYSTLPNCESTYPNVVKYKNFCITAGDIPYGEVVDNKVNPRLVSRDESFTGNYSRKEALDPVDGLLYPNLNVLTQ